VHLAFYWYYVYSATAIKLSKPTFKILEKTKKIFKYNTGQAKLPSPGMAPDGQVIFRIFKNNLSLFS
jgi:hypothetical protein